jgi:polyphosphate kinase
VRTPSGLEYLVRPGFIGDAAGFRPDGARFHPDAEIPPSGYLAFNLWWHPETMPSPHAESRKTPPTSPVPTTEPPTADLPPAGRPTTSPAPAVQSPAPVPAPRESRFLDREISWLRFNERVLELAQDTSHVPLLERVRFLAIFASNLDEFYMVRVAGLKRRLATGVATTSASGLPPREVLKRILAETRDLMDRHAAVFQEKLRPELADVGVSLVHWNELDEPGKEQLYSLFRNRIFPVLTPLAVDPSHPFPYISGLSLNLAVDVRDPVTGMEHFARVKVPPLLPRLIEAGPGRFVPLEEVIAAHLGQLFPGMEIIGQYVFRVTRNEDLEVEADAEENLLQALERELMRRRFGPPVRLEVEESVDPRILDLLVRELGIADDEVFRLPTPLDLTGLTHIADVGRAGEYTELRFPAFVPKTHPDLQDEGPGKPADVFAAIRRRDILLHHPYDSFATSVQAFLEQAAEDPDVLAIKQTLYRTSGDSPIVDALVDAAEAGKQVLVLVEIKARFDEHANISWARKLEQAGCHVVYGLIGLKTHSKLSLVVRREGDRLRRYSHIGTGNYNPKTARGYEDLGLLTCDPEVGGDLSDLFNRLSGYAHSADFDRLLTAPNALRAGLVERIAAQRDRALAGRPARIRIKVNSLVDEAVIDALYEASSAGVPVELWVRGICALRPGVPGLSENIRVRSILGRFLEHSRAFTFGCGDEADEAEVWIGSSDLMHRNLDRRVEAIVRLVEASQRKAIDALFDLAMDAGTAAWELGPDGSWTRTEPGPDGEPLTDLQETLIAGRAERWSGRTA